MFAFFEKYMKIKRKILCHKRIKLPRSTKIEKLILSLVRRARKPKNRSYKSHFNKRNFISPRSPSPVRFLVPGAKDDDK